ncbi:MAG: AraC family transcriptional regulator [Alphaproteobacteria bacterium]
MSLILSEPTLEVELVDRSATSVRYLEHGWPHSLCRWHAHQEYELHLILETEGTAFIGDYVGRFIAGGLYLTGPWLAHNWITDKPVKAKTAVRDMLIQFDDESLNQLARIYPESNILTPMLERARNGILYAGFPVDDAKAYLSDIKKKTGFDRLLSFFNLLHRLSQWQDQRILSVAANNRALGWSNHERINRVVKYVMAEFQSSISLHAASKIAGMSESAFSRYFHKITGSNFVEFVNRVRIGHACAMLIETNERISSICYGAGFSNIANFNRQFIRLKDLTPSAYRANIRNKMSREIAREITGEIAGEQQAPPISQNMNH